MVVLSPKGGLMLNTLTLITINFVLYPGELILSEMSTSGDLKSGDCLFFTTPPPPPHTEFQRTPAPRNIDPAPNGKDLGHYMTSYMMYVLSKFEIIVLMLEIVFFND